MAKTIGIYLRVSSKGQDVASQEAELKEWAAAQEAKGNQVTWYRDTFTGKTMDRPDLKRLMADLRKGKLATVAVWRLDRLGRTTSGVVQLLDELTAKKVNFVSLRDGFDLATPAGRLVANILASVAAYETEVRGERVAAGLAVKKQKVAAGLDTWNSGRPLGSFNKLTPELIGLVKTMKAEGKAVAAIARATKLSRPTVYKALEAV